MTLTLCRSDSLHTIEPWTVQVLFLPEIRTPQVTARLSAEGYIRNLAALQGLQDHLNAISGGEHFEVNIEERGPLDSVSPYGDQWWCGIDDVAQWIDPNASVVLVSYEIDDDSKQLSLNGLGGLGYYNNGIAYGAVPAWDGEQLYILDMWGLDPYVHEMLHGVCGYLASKGVPMPELHAPSEYGFGGEREKDWYPAILSGTVAYRSGAALTNGSPIPANGELIGCTAAAWNVGSPR